MVTITHLEEVVTITSWRVFRLVCIIVPLYHLAYGRMDVMIKQLEYSYPDDDSNGDPLDTWEDVEDMPDHDDFDDEYGD